MIAEALQLAAALNLACSGVQIDLRGSHGRYPQRRQASFSTVFRVDPARKLWCADDCTTVRPLHGVDEKLITLEFAWGKDVQLINSVTLADGSLLLSDQDKRHWTIRRGTCRQLPFTGFPEAPARP